jgi:hypothetical protein
MSGDQKCFPDTNIVGTPRTFKPAISRKDEVYLIPVATQCGKPCASAFRQNILVCFYFSFIFPEAIPVAT